MSEEKNNPVLDEQTLGKLLEAAYVLQEHNRELRELELCLELKRDQVEAEDRATTSSSKAPKPRSSETAAADDYTLTLAQIVETQHHIQVRQLELENAMTLVAQRVIDITHASGAAVGMVDGNSVQYRAVAGQKTLAKGTSVPTEKALCTPCLKTGQVFRSADVNREFLIDADECRRRGIESMIAVPVFHNGTAAGGLELYYSAHHGFTEQDVHTCQLMAGLITEALARDEEVTSKKSLANERAAMLDALEKLRPNLAALMGESTAKEASAKATAPHQPYSCRKCGHILVGEEQFCGQCGTPRGSDYEPPTMQSKVASLWEMQELRNKNNPPPTGEDVVEEIPKDFDEPERSLAQSMEAEFPELFASSDVSKDEPDDKTTHSETPPLELLNTEFEDDLAGELEVPPKAIEEVTAPEEAVALAKPAPPANWRSAASAREFLEQLASANHSPSLLKFWNTRRGDIYLAIAVILVACVIRWGIWSDHSVNATTAANSATAAHHKAPEPNLSLFDRILIGLGLAEPPDRPEDKGSPGVQVWVDTRTALYYCPGTDLYGKTPKGKFVTQREAQLDQFEPAFRKACD